MILFENYRSVFNFYYCVIKVNVFECADAVKLSMWGKDASVGEIDKGIEANLIGAPDRAKYRPKSSARHN